MSSIHPSIHQREHGSYPSSLRLRAVAPPTAWMPVYRMATWKDKHLQSHLHSLYSSQFATCLHCGQQPSCPTAWVTFPSLPNFPYGHPRAIEALGLLRISCSLYSLPCRSAEEFNLCCWLTLLFAWAKIRTFNTFLKT